ncbi:MAG: DUF805 domain-containing protein [Acidimicrobiales bacterium]|nr:MAG: DUF805 domain-containing protein [Acidimicrobiales bacterium]
MDQTLVPMGIREDTDPFEEMKDALTSGYRDFSGRSTRSQFWTFHIFSLVLVAFAAMPAIFTGNEAWSAVTTLPVLVGLFIPLLAITARRLHDTGRTAKLAVIAIIPWLGALLLLIILMADSEPEVNQWGESPKFIYDTPKTQRHPRWSSAA